MNKPALSLGALATSLALLAVEPAQALSAKTFVSNSGSDASPCTIGSPCATFQRAHDQTSPGGEVDVLTAGDYGGGSTLTISKAINIINDGVGEASVLAGGLVNGIKISAGAGDIVILRGLVVDGQVSGSIGIDFFHGSALHVQNCVVRNFEDGNSGAVGLVFQPTGTSQLFVSDTLVYNNGSTANSGGVRIAVAGANASAAAVLDRVRLENNVFGLQILGTGSIGTAGSHVILRDSVISGNFGNGIHALTTAGHPQAFAVIERTSLVDNQPNGILADGPGATVLLSDSTVTRNNAGISTVNSGQLLSYGNNLIDNNIGLDGAPTGLLTLN